MVVIHVKRSEQDQFLYECSTQDSNDDVIRDLVKIWNNRIRMKHLAALVEQLCAHGVAKAPEKRGIDEILEKSGEVIEKGPNYNADPTGERTGNAPDARVVEVLQKVLSDGLSAVDKVNVARKQSLSSKVLTEHFQTLKGAVAMAYPMGLPDYDPIKIMLEEALQEGHDENESGVPPEYLSAATAELWWAGKQFHREETVSSRVGRNEKTKIVARLQARGSGAPQREPGITEEERKAMMAHYFKKQEELKRLSEADDDDYLHSSWANPAGLKAQLRGTTNIKPF